MTDHSMTDHARFRSPAYLAFIRRQPCLNRHRHGSGGRPRWSPFYLAIDPDHYTHQKWRAGTDADALPLCRYCHSERHGMAKEAFYRAASIEVSREFVRLHVLFLNEMNLEMWAQESFEECLERNGLGTHEREKKSKSSPASEASPASKPSPVMRKKPRTVKRKKKKAFTKKFIPIKNRKV